MKVLVTGGSGFIGRALCTRLAEAGDAEVVATVRSAGGACPPAGSVVARELAPDTHWSDLLDSVDVVVHSAALVHAASGTRSLAEYRRVNVEGTLTLAHQAAACGVRRFVFLSSVKVNGESTPPGCRFRAEDPPAPVDPYGRTKHEAEIALRRLGGDGAMEVVTIRPPLVYGPGVKANFRTLMHWVYKGYPLPFARLRNARSLIALQNLVDLILTCIVHPRAANETFMAADGEDVSTAELVSRLGVALGRPAHLFPVPGKVLLALATVGGRREQARKLVENLQVDVDRTRQLLGWTPAVGMDEALAGTARHFLATRP